VVENHYLPCITIKTALITVQSVLLQHNQHIY